MVKMSHTQPEALDSSQQDLLRDTSSDTDFIFSEQTLGVVSKPSRSLSEAESAIIETIENCFRNWYGPWRKAYLDGGEEFSAIHGLMEHLMHYETQITNSEQTLSKDRTHAIIQAVVRLVDHGNAILNLDLILRANDGTTRELDPTSVTTIELYRAHVEAQKLRNKLRYNYFKRDKLNYVVIDTETANSSPSLPIPSPTSVNPSNAGSNTSINNPTNENGRRTSQMLTNQVGAEAPASDDLVVQLTNDQLEVRDMIATMKSSTFTDCSNVETRRALLTKILPKIKSLMLGRMTAEDSNNIFELLDLLFITIERLPSDCRQDEVTMIAISLLKFMVRKLYCVEIENNRTEFQHSHWTTYLLSLMRLMTPTDFSTYLKHFTNHADLSAFLKDYLFIVKRLVASNHEQAYSSKRVSAEADVMSNRAEPIYPNCWIEMSLVVCEAFLKSLRSLYQTLRQNYPSNQNSHMQMWKNYIDCLVYFMLQDTLRPGRLMYKQRQRLLANDLRKTAADYVWITWDDQRQSKEQWPNEVLEDLIGPLLRACMVLDSKQRAILLPIFNDMMCCDYTNQYITPRGSIYNPSAGYDHQTRLNYLNEDDCGYCPNGTQRHRTSDINQFGSKESLPYLSLKESSSDDGTVLTKFTHLAIDKLNDLIVDVGLGDAEFKEEFCNTLSGKIQSEYNYNQTSSLNKNDLSQFKSMAKHTSDIIAEFMQITLDYREASRLSYNHLCLMCLFKLILFFRDKVYRIELYLAYLHKLWSLHHNTGRYAEAGFTLLEHARTLPWSDEPIEGHYRIITQSFNTEPIVDYSSLKMFLYSTIIEYFDKGQLWEAAVPLCRELIEIYQFRTYDYVKLAEILAKLSTFFANITNVSLRSYPEYFRVAFYGRGYPKCLQGATMVYRGKPYEKLGEFQATILNKYPDAKLLTTLGRPDEHLINEPDAKYLQINACSPIVDLSSKFGANNPGSTHANLSKIDSSILNYYRHNECDKFEFSRRISRPAQLSSDNQVPHSADDGHGGGSRVARSETISEDNFAHMWRERTTLTTNSLPGMLPFFAVYLTETNIVSPIECAIEDLERINDRLSSMVNRLKADKHRTEDVRLLSPLLLGMVDSPVNGGITKYEKAFGLCDQQYQQQHQPPPIGDNRVASSLTPSTTNHRVAVVGSASKQQQTTTSTSQQQDDTPQLHRRLSAGLPHHQNDHTTSTILAPLQPANLKQSEQQHLVDRCHGSAAMSLSPPPMTGYMGNGGGGGGGGTGNANGQLQPNSAQVNKLKCLIAEQVPLLDEAIRLHCDRVADEMRPQHEHIEASYMRLKHHIMSKYSRFLPPDYNHRSHSASSTLIRSYQRHSRARSPAAISQGSVSMRSSIVSFDGTGSVAGGGGGGGLRAQGTVLHRSSFSSATVSPFPAAAPTTASNEAAANNQTPADNSSSPLSTWQLPTLNLPSVTSCDVPPSINHQGGGHSTQTPASPSHSARSKRSSDTSCRSSSEIPYQQLTDRRRSPTIMLTGDVGFDYALIRDRQAGSRSRRPSRLSTGARCATAAAPADTNRSNEIYCYLDTPPPPPPMQLQVQPPPPPPPPPRSRKNSSNSSSTFESAQAYVCLSDLMPGGTRAPANETIPVNNQETTQNGLPYARLVPRDPAIPIERSGGLKALDKQVGPAGQLEQSNAKQDTNHHDDGDNDELKLVSI